MTVNQIGWTIVAVLLILAAVGTCVIALRLHLRSQWAALAWATLCVSFIVLAFVTAWLAIYP